MTDRGDVRWITAFVIVIAVTAAAITMAIADPHTVADRYDFWLNRYQTLLGVLVAIVAATVAYSASKEATASSERIARDAARAAEKVAVDAWADAREVIAQNAEAIANAIDALPPVVTSIYDLPKWQVATRRLESLFRLQDRAAELMMLSELLPPRKRLIAIRAAARFRSAQETFEKLDARLDVGDLDHRRAAAEEAWSEYARIRAIFRDHFQFMLRAAEDA